MEITTESSTEVGGEEYDEAISFEALEPKRGGAGTYISGLVRRQGDDFTVVMLNQDNRPCSSPEDIGSDHRNELESHFEEEYGADLMYEL